MFLFTIDDKMSTPKIYFMGDFSFIEDKYSAEMVADAYQAITNTEGGWEFLKEWSPPEGEGFMFCSHPKLSEIDSRMKMHDQHSGSSYAWTMRNAEYIAKHGWSPFVQLWQHKNSDVEKLREEVRQKIARNKAAAALAMSSEDYE